MASNKKSKTKAKSKPKAKVKAKAKAKAKTKVKAAPKTKARSKAISKAKPKTKTETKTQSKKSAQSVSFTPIQDHILIKPEGESDRTPGGLYIPATAQDKPLRGLVVAAGKGGKNKKGQLRPLDVKLGETVIYSNYAGSKVTLSGEEYIILKESGVLGVVRS